MRVWIALADTQDLQSKRGLGLQPREGCMGMRYNSYPSRKPVRIFVTLDADIRDALEAHAEANGSSLSAAFHDLVWDSFEPELQKVRSARAKQPDGPLFTPGRPLDRNTVIRVDPDTGRTVIVDRDLAAKLHDGRCRINAASYRIEWTRDTVIEALSRLQIPLRQRT